MTITEFMKSEKSVIHCKTRKEAEVLLQEFDRLGLEWCDGMKYTDHSNWSNYREKTCYHPQGGDYTHMEYFLEDGYTIVPFNKIEIGERKIVVEL